MRTRDYSPHDPPHHNRSKLTSAQRDEIRRRYADGQTAISLAAEYGVTTATIRRYTEARRHA